MTEKRDKPYIWISWLAKYIAGETMCEWSVWFKAHHTYEKMPSDFDLAKWMVDHVALLRKRAELLTNDGWIVHIEDQNSFKIETESCIVAGKPDIVSNRTPIAGRTDPVYQYVVEDCKTGKRRLSDHTQVALYMYFLKKIQGVSFNGNIIYKNGIALVKSDAYGLGFEDAIAEALGKLSSNDPPAMCPSVQECRRCDISECKSRGSYE